MRTNSRPTALITGASSGIGATYAERLADRGYDLVLVARRADRLAELADQLKARANVEVEVLSTDLSTDEGIEAVERRLAAEPTIELLLNNAGIPSGGPLTGGGRSKIDQLIDVNVRAVTRLASAAAVKMRERGAGAIINVASVVGIAPEISPGLYGASKAFVIALSKILQLELDGTGIYVQALLPAATRTDIWAIGGRDPDQIAGMMDVDKLVDAALAGFDAREAVTIPSLSDASQWDSYERLRLEMIPNFINSEPADRYKRVVAA
jgi:short-subunit dehydrogenase